jgi:hypothetical protein
MVVAVFLNALYTQNLALHERPFHQVHMKVHTEPNALASNLHPELVPSTWSQRLTCYQRDARDRHLQTDTPTR